MHILKKSLIPEIVKEKLEVEQKEFLSRTRRKEQLKYGCLSASIGNFRESEDRKSHLPLTMFKS